MTNDELSTLRNMRACYESMVSDGGKAWDQCLYNEYVKSLLSHAGDLLEYASTNLED